MRNTSASSSNRKTTGASIRPVESWRKSTKLEPRGREIFYRLDASGRTRKTVGAGEGGEAPDIGSIEGVGESTERRHWYGDILIRLFIERSRRWCRIIDISGRHDGESPVIKTFRNVYPPPLGVAIYSSTTAPHPTAPPSIPAISLDRQIYRTGLNILTAWFRY